MAKTGATYTGLCAQKESTDWQLLSCTTGNPIFDDDYDDDYGGDNGEGGR